MAFEPDPPCARPRPRWMLRCRTAQTLKIAPSQAMKGFSFGLDPASPTVWPCRSESSTGATLLSR